MSYFQLVRHGKVRQPCRAAAHPGEIIPQVHRVAGHGFTMHPAPIDAPAQTPPLPPASFLPVEIVSPE